jgi:hypothetical protein
VTGAAGAGADRRTAGCAVTAANAGNCVSQIGQVINPVAEAGG